jgi:hypothetical protein
MDDAKQGNGDRKVPPRRLSRVLREMALRAREPVSVAQIRDALADRSFAALLVVFAAINLLPLPPGTTLVLGLPLVIISVQLMLGYEKAWLPAFVLTKSFTPQQLIRMTDRLSPLLMRAERYIRPRYWPLSNQMADRLIGLFAFIMGVAVTLPIPFGNWFPALATTMIGLALSERDGILLAAALLVGLFALGIIALVIGAAGFATTAVLSLF